MGKGGRDLLVKRDDVIGETDKVHRGLSVAFGVLPLGGIRPDGLAAYHLAGGV
jgi:hypothetical protein